MVLGAGLKECASVPSGLSAKRALPAAARSREAEDGERATEDGESFPSSGFCSLTSASWIGRQARCSTQADPSEAVAICCPASASQNFTAPSWPPVASRRSENGGRITENGGVRTEGELSGAVLCSPSSVLCAAGLHATVLVPFSWPGKSWRFAPSALVKSAIGPLPEAAASSPPVRRPSEIDHVVVEGRGPMFGELHGSDRTRDRNLARARSSECENEKDYEERERVQTRHALKPSVSAVRSRFLPMKTRVLVRGSAPHSRSNLASKSMCTP